MGSFRGSPPPLHRRLSTPTGSGSALGRRSGGGLSGGKGQSKPREQHGKGLAGVGVLKQGSWDGGEDVGEGDDERGTPPPPPSLFDSVFKDKLPSLTPRKTLPATPR